MRIAIFDYTVVPTNPVGGCHLRMLQGLCGEHEFTVFALKFENPCPARIEWVRIRTFLPTRPQVLLLISYHLLAPIYFWLYCFRRGIRFDVIQMVESTLSFGDVAYCHFCHRAYLKHHWKRVGLRGLRGTVRWIDHQLRALLEPWVLRRVRHIVAPSRGVAREFASEYPNTPDKIHILPNSVDIAGMQPGIDFDRVQFRRQIGAEADDLVLTFVALGQFERKGLHVLGAALKRVNNPELKVVVVGGQPDLVATYRRRMTSEGLGNQVLFMGMQRDVRPFLWGADAFVLASFYEVFPLVVLEAAAAGLPLIVTPVSGVEDFVRDGENAIVVEPSVDEVAKGLRRFLALSPSQRQQMGECARRDVKCYDQEHFVAAWRDFYQTVRPAPRQSAGCRPIGSS